ncbi:MAG: hypothetical protein ACR2PZ_01285 [Pseudomonadales bacterium]
MQPLSDLEITDLLPHRPPMLLLDQVLAAREQELWCRIDLTEHSTFAEADGIPSNLALEYLAQTAAALLGLRAKTEVENAAPPAPGMLIGCSKLHSAIAFFPPACSLVAWVQLSSALPTQFTGLIRVRGEVAVFAPAQLDALETAELTEQWPVEPAVRAELSVYLPPAGASPQDSQRQRE